MSFTPLDGNACKPQLHFAEIVEMSLLFCDKLSFRVTSSPPTGHSQLWLLFFFFKLMQRQNVLYCHSFLWVRQIGPTWRLMENWEDFRAFCCWMSSTWSRSGRAGLSSSRPFPLRVSAPVSLHRFIEPSSRDNLIGCRLQDDAGERNKRQQQQQHKNHQRKGADGTNAARMWESSSSDLILRVKNTMIVGRSQRLMQRIAKNLMEQKEIWLVGTIQHLIGSFLVVKHLLSSTE